jgi:hypothetical protein
MKNGVHLLNLSKIYLLEFLFKINFFIFNRFFQRMAIFTFYFAICLFGLIIRGYYRVPQTCLIHEVIDKEENTVKSIIANRIECKCHYTNFLWHKPHSANENRTLMNNSLGIHNDEDNEKQIFEPMALVR